MAYNHEQEFAIKKLWKAKIIRMILDAVSEGTKPTDRAIRRTALNWFDTKNSDFCFTCRSAGLNPYFVQEKFNSFIKNGDKQRLRGKKIASSFESMSLNQDDSFEHFIPNSLFDKNYSEYQLITY